MREMYTLADSDIPYLAFRNQFFKFFPGGVWVYGEVFVVSIAFECNRPIDRKA